MEDRTDPHARDAALARIREAMAQRSAVHKSVGVFTPAGQDRAVADTYAVEEAVWEQMVSRYIATGTGVGDALEFAAFMAAASWAREQAYEYRRWAKAADRIMAEPS